MSKNLGKSKVGIIIEAATTAHLSVLKKTASTQHLKPKPQPSEQSGSGNKEGGSSQVSNSKK